MITRRQKILTANYQPLYSLFLLKNKREPFSRTPYWKNNIVFIEWANSFKNSFRKSRNYPEELAPGFYEEYWNYVKTEFQKYIKPLPIKTRYGSKKHLKQIPDEADKNYFIQEGQRIQKKIDRIKKRIEEFTANDLWDSTDWDPNNLHDTLEHYENLLKENAGNFGDWHFSKYGFMAY